MALFEEERTYKQLIKLHEQQKIAVLVVHWPKECYQALEKYRQESTSRQLFLIKSIQYLEMYFQYILSLLSSEAKKIFTEKVTMLEYSSRDTEDLVEQLEYVFGPFLLRLLFPQRMAVTLEKDCEARFLKRKEVSVELFDIVQKSKQDQLLLLTKHDLHQLSKIGNQSVEFALMKQLEAGLKLKCSCYKVSVVIPVLIEKYQLNRFLDDRLHMLTILEKYGIAYRIHSSSVDACLFHLEQHEKIDEALTEIKRTVDVENIQLGSKLLVIDRAKRSDSGTQKSIASYSWQRKLFFNTI